MVVQEINKVQELQCARKDCSLALREYAVRFLKHNSSDALHSQAEAPMTPDRISDLGITDILLEDNLIEVRNEFNFATESSICMSS